MRVKFKLYRYNIEIDGSELRRERRLVGLFHGLMLPVSIGERATYLANIGEVEFRLYPLTPVTVLVSDEIEVDGKVYQVISVTLSQTKYITSSVLLRGVQDVS